MLAPNNQLPRGGYVRTMRGPLTVDNCRGLFSTAYFGRDRSDVAVDAELLLAGLLNQLALIPQTDGEIL